MIWEIWIGALVLYALFCLWYFNTKVPLTAEEIDKYVMATQSRLPEADPDDIRKFLEKDDGREFIMQNMLSLHEGKVAHPQSGDLTSPRQLLQLYFQPSMKSILKRAGHPVHQTVRLGGRIDAWNCGKDQGYQVWAMVRYRSRRDFMISVTTTNFAHLHVFKQAAIAMTEAYPTNMQMSLFMRPHKAIALILLLIASLMQNFTFIL